jgi:hypothetical protein
VCVTVVDANPVDVKTFDTVAILISLCRSQGRNVQVHKGYLLVNGHCYCLLLPRLNVTNFQSDIVFDNSESFFCIASVRRAYNGETVGRGEGGCYRAAPPPKYKFQKRR